MEAVHTTVRVYGRHVPGGMYRVWYTYQGMVGGVYRSGVHLPPYPLGRLGASFTSFPFLSREAGEPLLPLFLLPREAGEPLFASFPWFLGGWRASFASFLLFLR